jgi:hypothetical protein
VPHGSARFFRATGYNPLVYVATIAAALLDSLNHPVCQKPLHGVEQSILGVFDFIPLLAEPFRKFGLREWLIAHFFDGFKGRAHNAAV